MQLGSPCSVCSPTLGHPLAHGLGNGGSPNLGHVLAQQSGGVIDSPVAMGSPTFGIAHTTGESPASSPAWGFAQRTNYEACSPTFGQAQHTTEACSLTFGQAQHTTEACSPTLSQARHATEACSPTLGLAQSADNNDAVSSPGFGFAQPAHGMVRSPTIGPAEPAHDAPSSPTFGFARPHTAAAPHPANPDLGARTGGHALAFGFPAQAGHSQHAQHSQADPSSRAQPQTSLSFAPPTVAAGVVEGKQQPTSSVSFAGLFASPTPVTSVSFAPQAAACVSFAPLAAGAAGAVGDRQLPAGSVSFAPMAGPVGVEHKVGTPLNLCCIACGLIPCIAPLPVWARGAILMQFGHMCHPLAGVHYASGSILQLSPACSAGSPCPCLV